MRIVMGTPGAQKLCLRLQSKKVKKSSKHGDKEKKSHKRDDKDKGSKKDSKRDRHDRSDVASPTRDAHPLPTETAAATGASRAQVRCC